jgi:glycyl-tRNA synthetase beta chain
MSDALLVELFTEELPPKALQRLGEAFAHGLRDELAANGLLASDCKLEVFATPRRLAARFSSVLGKAADRQTEERLLPEKVGLDAAGKPTAALLKKLAALGRDESAVASIKKASDGKLVMLFLPTLAAGQTLQAGLQAALEQAIERLPIPKVMSYQLPNSTRTVKFVRPAHGLVALHGSAVVAVEALGLKAGRITHGHRFLGARDIELKHAGEYEARLNDEGKVVAGFEVRRAQIETQLKAKAAQLGCTLGEYEALLDEVTALVEWPAVYVAGFEPEFLAVPQECLILTMRTNQKYFPLFDSVGKTAGKLTEKFLLVSNMQVADPKNIIEGNQRVVRPRLADARFFYDQDRKARLESRVPALGKVVYHNKLGSQLERVERVQLLAGKIARLIGTDPLLAERAAWLAKADLQTGMVGEFPELQGIMGRYYAQHDGEPAVVADAIAEHYLPRFAGDKLPQSKEACCVALADKLDTIIGIFGTGAIPTGDKDPFALRRHALGVIRILAEHKLPLHPGELLKLAHETFPKGTLLAHHERKGLAVPNDIEAASFVLERARSYLRELGYSALEVESVLDLSPRPLEYVSRLDAARQFLALPESAGLAEADKRIRNILSKSDSAAAGTHADTALIKETEENQLLMTTRRLRAEVDVLLTRQQFGSALQLTAQLHQPVTQFFDKVMVNVEDPSLRNNRFALLHEVGALTNQVVNISKLAT